MADARMGPPKTILAPPPPPAPPPPNTRSVKGASPRTPLAGGFGNTSTLGVPPAPTRTPPGMGAPVVPQHRNDMLNQMLRGLENDNLTVADVLGVLETELRSGAPAAQPYGPLSDVSGPPPEKGPGAKVRAPEPYPSDFPLMGPAPTGLAVPALGAGGGHSRRPAGGGSGAGGGGVDDRESSQRVVMNCARCAVLEQQVKALSQSLSGLGARMFNWSLAHCKENNERNGMWHLIVKYLQPVNSVDAKIAETCAGLQSAIGTTGTAHVPAGFDLPTNKPNRSNAGGAGNRGRSTPSRPVSPGRAGYGGVWQPPGVNAAAAANFGAGSPVQNTRGARFAENPMHQAAAPSPTTSPKGRLPQSAVQMREYAVSPPMNQGIPTTPASPSSQRFPAAEGFGPMTVEITVRFGISRLAKKLNGVYTMIPGVKTNQRPVYENGQKHIVYLSDGNWVIKDGPDADLDVNVYAYVKDTAIEPHKVRRPWYVAADGDGFVADTKGTITPGRSETSEMVKAAKVAELMKQHEEAGLRAEAASIARDRRDVARIQAASEAPSMLEAKTTKSGKAPPKIPYEDISGEARIHIQIISAQGLRRADIGSSSDPFVFCEIPGKGYICKTPTINDTLKPVWNFEHVAQYTPGHNLRFTVWDADCLRSDLLGEAELLSDRFYPNSFRGELALKDDRHNTQATLNIRIDVLEHAEADKWGEDYDYDYDYDARGANTHEDDPEIQNYRKAFDKFDIDRSGFITLNELTKVMQSLGLNETEDELRLLMGKVDRTNNGVDFLEFLELMDRLQQEDGENQERAKFRAMFQTFDVNGDGFIGKEELLEIFRAVQKSSTIDDAELQRLVQNIDGDGSGYIDFNEFMSLMNQVVRGEEGNKVVAPDITGLMKGARLVGTLAPSDRKAIKAYLKRRGFPGQDVNTQKNTGGPFSKKGYEYPLHTAAVENLPDMVWLLLESDANPLATNSANQTPYQAALKAENNKGTHKKVLEHLKNYESTWITRS